jgi:hypothetical protein
MATQITKKLCYLEMFMKQRPACKIYKVTAANTFDFNKLYKLYRITVLDILFLNNINTISALSA